MIPRGDNASGNAQGATADTEWGTPADTVLKTSNA